MENKQLWRFTFGCGMPNEGKCQPILADSFGSAREKMFELHGPKWAFQYSEEEWDEIKNDKNRYWEMEEDLETVEV